MYLDTTTKSLEIVLGGATTTNAIPWVADYGEVANDNSTSAPKNARGTTNNTPAVTIVSAPAANLVRELLHLTVHNADTVAATVTIQLNDGGTRYALKTVILQTTESLNYESPGGWYCIDTNGNLKSKPASLPLPSGAAQDGTDGSGITPPTAAVGIRGWLSGIYSLLLTVLTVNLTKWNGTAPTAAAALADGLSAPTAPAVAACLKLRNAAGTWDDARAAVRATGLASAARTANASFGAITNTNNPALILYLNVTAAPVTPGAGGLTLALYGYDGLGNSAAVWQSAVKVTATGFYVYELGPGASAAVQQSVKERLAMRCPITWAGIVFVGDAQSYTYSVTYDLFTG